MAVMHNLSDVEGSKNACHHDQDEDMGCHRRRTRLLSRLGLGVFRPDRDEDFEASVWPSRRRVKQLQLKSRKTTGDSTWGFRSPKSRLYILCTTLQTYANATTHTIELSIQTIQQHVITTLMLRHFCVMLRQPASCYVTYDITAPRPLVWPYSYVPVDYMRSRWYSRCHGPPNSQGRLAAQSWRHTPWQQAHVSLHWIRWCVLAWMWRDLKENVIMQDCPEGRKSGVRYLLLVHVLDCQRRDRGREMYHVFLKMIASFGRK